MKAFHSGRIILLLFLCSFFSVLSANRCLEIGVRNTCRKKTIQDQEYRAQFFSTEQREGDALLSKECLRFLRHVENEVSYYPVAESSVDKSLTTSLINSWMKDRSYGGARGHEGTDLMASVNKRGLYPIVSMTDGVVTNLGWLEKGGYRVGITSDSGTYYYYAHLESYSNINEGERVKAGELLGFMGDSGYGPEGTTGNFAVHLHVGIYFYENGNEVSVNPYYVLKYLESKKLKYVFKN